MTEMLTLTLLRHAKAAPLAPNQADQDRPLTDRGRAAATMAGRTLRHLGIDHALVSIALRTRETWEIACREMEPPARVIIEPGLYMCRRDQLIARIRAIPPTARNVVIVGHNPCMHDTAMWLAGRVKDPALKAIAFKFPTAAIAVFTLLAPDWQTLSQGGARLDQFLTPGPDD